VSETTVTESFDLRAEIARIDRDRAETQKLAEETRKYVAEAHKLDAETRKLNREYRWFPWLQMALTIVAAVAAISAAIVAHLR
jgi:type IV secretory pathway component VirB8